jgi:hypothetical protein
MEGSWLLLVGRLPTSAAATGSSADDKVQEIATGLRSAVTFEGDPRWAL